LVHISKKRHPDTQIYFRKSFLQQLQANHRQVWAHPKKIYWQDQYMPWGLTTPSWLKE